MEVRALENTQLLKGILEGCILSIISKGETYGYEILTELERYNFINLGEGTLYPILLRLDKKGYLICRKGKSPFGPTRKYYSISEEGLKWLQEFKKNYKEITKCANAIIFDNHKGGL